MPFTFEPQTIPEVIHITSTGFADERGVFNELFKNSEFSSNGIATNFVQVNQSVSRQGVIRALHYQNPPHAQGKLVMVTQGEVFDVAVDIRRKSPTYGQWVGVTLSLEKRNMLYIPPGFAHGFAVLSLEAQLLYFCTDEYSKADEAGIAWNDPTLNIAWPIENPILSAKDKAFPSLEEAHNAF